MFCSQCGVNASGKFCYQCGSPLQAPNLALHAEVAETPANREVDWDSEVCYETIIRVDAVRLAISKNASAAPKGLSGEAILELYDKFVTSPIPLESLASIVQPLYDSWGIHTGKERIAVIEVPIGRAIARSLCSLAKHGQTLQSAEQSESACFLSAELPSSVCSLKGKLTVSVMKRGQFSQIEASTNIPGQMYDWGKSQRCLDSLFSDLKSDMGLPPAQLQRKAA